ncbi:MAG: hypothetical protein F6J96_29020 [Symploca sp. SIO1C2]|nr:hypothetical protein [Symploca sp. SIO1C2]
MFPLTLSQVGMTTHHHLVTGYLKYHRLSKTLPVTIIITGNYNKVTGYLELITSSLLIGDPPQIITG